MSIFHFVAQKGKCLLNSISVIIENLVRPISIQIIGIFVKKYSTGWGFVSSKLMVFWQSMKMVVF